MTYPLASASGDGAVPASPRFPDVEAAVLRHWRADGTFEASVEQRGRDDEYVFYDGPPFANGLPHYGHLLTGFVKDVVPRYRTMRGQRVERRFGWDCHGLPAEVEAERQLGLRTKAEIEAMGVARFNDACRASVLRYTGEWEEHVTRQARWVDFEHDYKTLDTDYMESVMWAFKTLWEKGLVYEGFRVLAYCWRDGTPLSTTETRMDDVYRPRQDPAVTVGLTLTSGPAQGARVLVWTTTPWTLPSNMAVAVGPAIDYAVVDGPLGRVVLAEARLAHYARELGEAPQVVARLRGADLVGSTYTPPFTYFEGSPNAHQVLAADYVTTDDGTGAVHIAPAYGEEDKVVADAAGIETVVAVDSRGQFDARVPEYEGLQVFDANPLVVRDLKAATGAVTPGTLLVRQETYDHPYPHCYRCGNPLIYRAVSSWFVEVTKIKDRMLELNQQIDWVPEHVQDGSFGKWLEGARDWSISRNRYWGSPVPVWVSDDPDHPRTDVYGSLDELERDFGVRPADLHRPFVDQLTRPNPDDPTGRSTMRRVPEVLDCWFESGSMPFAQVHHPFENREWFDTHFPGDFIVEYVAQTRGWFYTMHVLATALFDRPAFRTALVHGIVLGDDGRKMSKSLRNYPDVSEVFARDGADAMRWFLMSSPVLRGGNLVTTEAGIREGVRQVLIPLWNAWYFLSLYAGAMPDGAGGRGVVGRWRTDSAHTLDRFVLGECHDLVVEVGELMDALDIAGACEAVRVFLDTLTNWYVRRSRARFWGEGPDARDAVDTLHTVLEVLTRVAAPLLPLTTEEVWRGLTGGRSVHLADFPDAADLPSDAGTRELVTAMEAARAACSTALGLRKAAGLRVRQPLPRLTVAVHGTGLAALADLVAEEVNVKEVVLLDLEEQAGGGTGGGDLAAEHGITQRLSVNARAAGPRLGREVQLAIQAARAGAWEVDETGTVAAGGIVLEPGEYELTTVVADGADGADSAGGGHRRAATLPGGGFVVLDTRVTDDLAAEGWANDVVRLVQDARKAAGLHVSDRMALRLVVPEQVGAWALALRDRIAGETLAERVDLSTGGDQVQVEVARL